MRRLDLLGEKFGRLTVLSRAENSPAGRLRWLCSCECGGTVTVQRGDLRSGHTKSCGCFGENTVKTLNAEAFNVPAEEAAYFAGFFDGEGCVGIKKPSKQRQLHQAYATVSQVRVEVLRKMKASFGGNIHFSKSGGTNGIWCWQSSGILHTIRVLKTLLPYLVVKKAEAEVVIEAFQLVTSARKFGTPSHIVDLREAARLRVMGMR